MQTWWMLGSDRLKQKYITDINPEKGTFNFGDASHSQKEDY